jgi:hypothetical protein
MANIKKYGHLFMRKSLIAVFALFLTAISNPVIAELEMTGYYYGVNFASGSFDKDFSGGTTDISESWGLLQGKFGKTINDTLSIEAQLGVSTNLSKAHGVSFLSTFLKVGRSFEDYTLYGLLGGTASRMYEDGYDTQHYSGFSYGAGIELFGSKAVSISLEIQRLLHITDNGADVNFDVSSLGFTYYFLADKSKFNKNRNAIRSIRY